MSSKFATGKYFPVKATYSPDGGGGLKLARVEAFDSARFNAEPPPPARPKAGAQQRQRDPAEDALASEAMRKPDDVRRAVRRVRQKVYDLIQCNPDLDAFVTFTYSPEVVQKDDYADCYPYLKNWLSNAVQRRGLRYICVPELTQKGDVHFHAICNWDALRVTEAINPHSGDIVRHRGDIVYNLVDWHAGFSTVQRIRARNAEDDVRTAVARYMWKYMGKNLGAKVGGRYALIGGEMVKPVNLFGEYPEEFAGGDLPEPYRVEIDSVGVYRKYEF